ncbi:MAG: DUF560 domain-containing protein [Betaproteobacteria bacterium]|nr:DUF560 domain-containing protein [Betaproteobacteria bacterium]
MTTALRCVSCLAAVCTVLLCGPVAAAPVDELKLLLARGQAKEAYARAARYPDQLGEPLFDYYFGMAAIDAGHPAEGTLALERYVITYPSDLTARLELARGYFLMGDDRRATEEFTRVRRTNPPSAVRTNIDTYLAAIDARSKRYRPSLSLFAEFGTGYDSNVNGGVSNANITLPIGQVIVQDAGVKTDNGFYVGAAAFQVNIPFAPGWSVFAGAAGDTKNHFTQDRFDLRSLTASAGLARTDDTTLVRVTGATGSLWLDDDRYRDVGSLTGEYYRQIRKDLVVSTSAQWAQLAYTGGNEARDADLFGVTAGLRSLRGGNWKWTNIASLGVAQEHNRRDRRDLGRDIYSGRLGLTATPHDGLSLYATASAQGSYYREADAFLGQRRRDWFFALEAGTVRALTRSWSFRVEVIASRNRSSIDLYDFNRNAANLKLRYELQ